MQAKTNMAKVAKTQGKAKKQHIISLDNRKKLVRAYYQLYRVFVLKNLLSGMTLGAASHNAMQLVRAKLSTMDKANPVTKYLLRINARHSKRVAKRIMTGKFRNARATAKPETRAKMTAMMPKWLQFSMNTFATMSALYKPKTVVKAQEKVAPKPNMQQNQNMMLLIKMQQISTARQHAA